MFFKFKYSSTHINIVNISVRDHAARILQKEENKDTKKYKVIKTLDFKGKTLNQEGLKVSKSENLKKTRRFESEEIRKLEKRQVVQRKTFKEVKVIIEDGSTSNSDDCSVNQGKQGMVLTFGNRSRWSSLELLDGSTR